MSIKITYLFLRTLSITNNVPLFATDGFAFNHNTPIKAVGTLYFLKKDGMISTQKIDDNYMIQSFQLPQTLDETIFSDDHAPLYVLPAL